MTALVPTWTLGDRLAKARKDAQLTTYEMAEKLGVTRATITNWENDHTHPRRYATDSWARITGVDAGWLATGIATGEAGLLDDDVAMHDPNERWLLAGSRETRSRCSDPGAPRDLPGFDGGVWCGTAPLLAPVPARDVPVRPRMSRARVGLPMIEERVA